MQITPTDAAYTDKVGLPVTVAQLIEILELLPPDATVIDPPRVILRRPANRES